MKHSVKTRLAAIALLSFLSSCSEGSGEGRVWGSLQVPACGKETEDFDMNVNFFEAEYFENTMTLRLMSDGGDARYSDGVYLVIRDVEETAEADKGAKEEISVEPSIESFMENGPDGGVPETTAASPARVSLSLGKSCPNQFLAFSDGAGFLQMDSIWVPGGSERISGSFNLKFIDARYWESQDSPGPTAELQGEFEFNCDCDNKARSRR